MKGRQFRIVLSVLCVLSILVFGALLYFYTTSSTSENPDPVACKEAMREQYRRALLYNEPGHRPSQCEGISDAVLNDFAEQILNEEMER